MNDRTSAYTAGLVGVGILGLLGTTHPGNAVVFNSFPCLMVALTGLYQMSKRPAEGMRIAVGTGIALAGAGAGTLPLIPQIQDKLDSEQKKSALVFSSAFGSVALGGVGLALILPNGAITVRNPASAVLSSIAPS